MLAALIQVVDNRVLCQGSWTLLGIIDLQNTIADVVLPAQQEIIINGAAVEKMDTAGAWFLHSAIKLWQEQGKSIVFRKFPKEYQRLLNLLARHATELDTAAAVAPPKKRNFLYSLGKQTSKKFRQALDFLSFIGELVVKLLQIATLQRKFQWRTFIKAIDESGFQALPIIGLLSFLIGVVLAYQMGLQLKDYGANIYVVNVTGLAILREFGPLIAAIIAAGRTSSALTAKIGAMIINEEVDALKTMGFSPVARLALPKVLAVVIAMPLLTVWADIFGVLGSMVMSKNMLGIGFEHFLQRFQDVIKLKPYLIGLSKAPVFGLLIAAVGCFQGFQVTAKAESVGKRTTKSVVQAIFLIIVADALFSVLFSWQDI